MASKQGLVFNKSGGWSKAGMAARERQVYADYEKVIAAAVPLDVNSRPDWDAKDVRSQAAARRKNDTLYALRNEDNIAATAARIAHSLRVTPRENWGRLDAGGRARRVAEVMVRANAIGEASRRQAAARRKG